MNRAPDGFCQCGCGQRTNLAPYSVAKHGWVKGEPLRYLRGHGAKGSGGLRRDRASEYVIDSQTGCWIWQKAKNEDGYGIAHWNGLRATAHHHYYIERRGAVPAGLELDHLCGNRACVNPEHLEAVTHAVNIARGRRRKLTDAQVMEIRASTEGNKVVAERFGITPNYVSMLRRGLGRPTPDFFVPLEDENGDPEPERVVA